MADPLTASQTPPPPPPLELEPISDPLPVLPDNSFPLWGYILAVLALLATAFFLRRRFKKTTNSSINRAREAFLDSRRMIEVAGQAKGNPNETATQLSFALRTYLSKVSADPTLFQTHEEFLISDEALASLPEKQRQLTGEFFEQLAELKYNKISHSDFDPEEICRESGDLLVNLHSHHIPIEAP